MAKKSTNQQEFTLKECAFEGCTVAVDESVQYCSDHSHVAEEAPAQEAPDKGADTEGFFHKATSTVTDLFGFKKSKEEKKVKAESVSFKKVKSIAWDKIQAGGRKLWAFAKQNKFLMLTGINAVLLGGMLTSTMGGAVLAGAAMAAVAVAAVHIIAKKKEQSMSYKAMLRDIGIASGVAASFPLALVAVAYAGMFLVAFCAILPLSVIAA